MSTPVWTPEEMSAIFARIGLPQPEPEAAERLRVLAGRVWEAGRAVPRMDNKEHAPAPVLSVPTAVRKATGAGA